MQRILSLSPRDRKMSASSLSKAMLRAFFFSGRLRVSQATPSASSIFARMNLLSAILGLLKSCSSRSNRSNRSKRLERSRAIERFELFEPVKALRVAGENLLLGLVRNIFATHHLAHTVRPFHVPMRIIGRIHHALVSELLNNQRQNRFLAFAGEITTMVFDVFARQHLERFHLRFSQKIFFVEALHPVRQKANSGFKKTDFELRKAIEH